MRTRDAKLESAGEGNEERLSVLGVRGFSGIIIGSVRPVFVWLVCCLGCGVDSFPIDFIRGWDADNADVVQLR